MVYIVDQRVHPVRFSVAHPLQVIYPFKYLVVAVEEEMQGHRPFIFNDHFYFARPAESGALRIILNRIDPFREIFYIRDGRG